jgi:hypothetical protein
LRELFRGEPGRGEEKKFRRLKVRRLRAEMFTRDDEVEEDDEVLESARAREAV